MSDEQLEAIRKRAENSIGRCPDWDDFEALLADVERLRKALKYILELYPTPYVEAICADALEAQP